MTTKQKIVFVIISIACALPAFLLGPKIWPDLADAVPPSAAQLPHLIILSAFDALVLGIGVAFVIFGWPLVRRTAPHDRRGATLVFLAIAWSLVSWWPHVNLHRSNGMDLDGLIRIDYGFHVTLMLGGLIVAYYFWRWTKSAAAR